MQTQLTTGQAAKFAWLGDRIRRPEWDEGAYIVAPGYPGYDTNTLPTDDDLLAEDWVAEYTEASV